MPPVDSSATVPPLPVPRPLAPMRAPAATITSRAVPAGMPAPPGAPCASARAAVVPIATVPPPARPLADTRAVDARATVSVAARVTVPPVVPGARPSARTAPAMLMEPPSADTVMVPGLPPTLLACSRPVLLTRLVMIPSAARAVSTTVPPSAATVPLLVTNTVAPPGACWTCRVTSTLIRPSP